MILENVAFFAVMRCRLPETCNASPEIQQPTLLQAHASNLLKRNPVSSFVFAKLA